VTNRRPPATPRRVVGLCLRLSPAEHARLSARARHARRSLSAYIRIAALTAKSPEPPVPPVNIAVVGELNRIGNNLNQAVHLLHTGVLSGDFAEALRELDTALHTLKRQLLGMAPRDPGS